MKLAIVDSTNCSEIKLESYLTETPDEILIRDSRIFSKIVRNFAQERNIVLREYLPKNRIRNKWTLIKTNSELIDACDSVLVFCDDNDIVVQAAINHAKGVHKDIKIVNINDNTETIYKSCLETNQYKLFFKYHIGAQHYLKVTPDDKKEKCEYDRIAHGYYYCTACKGYHLTSLPVIIAQNINELCSNDIDLTESRDYIWDDYDDALEKFTEIQDAEKAKREEIEARKRRITPHYEKVKNTTFIDLSGDDLSIDPRFW